MGQSGKPSDSPYTSANAEYVYATVRSENLLSRIKSTLSVSGRISGS